MSSASHLTKKACCGVVPKSAPERQTLVRKSDTLRTIFAQSACVFGSKTTNCMPSSIDSRRKSSVRRTLMYFRSAFASPPIVRAPQTRMLPLRSRMQLTPCGFSPSCCALLIPYFNPSAPKHRLVGRGFMHASLRVHAGIDAGDVTAGRDELQARRRRVLNLRGRIEDLDPGEVESREVGVVRQDVGGVRGIEQRQVEIAAGLNDLSGCRKWRSDPESFGDSACQLRCAHCRR